MLVISEDTATRYVGKRLIINHLLLAHVTTWVRCRKVVSAAARAEPRRRSNGPTLRFRHMIRSRVLRRGVPPSELRVHAWSGRMAGFLKRVCSLNGASAAALSLTAILVPMSAASARESGELHTFHCLHGWPPSSWTRQQSDRLATVRRECRWRKWNFDLVWGCSRAWRAGPSSICRQLWAATDLLTTYNLFTR